MHYNCLIVDDEVELAQMTCEYFEMFDVSCRYVETTAACLGFLKENTVDLLLLDINLKEESGFTLCKEIRQSSNIPILFISARQSDDDVLIALNIGGDDYIKKPYTLSVLLAKVRVMLKRLTMSGSEAKQKGDIEPRAELWLDEDTLCAWVKGKKVQLKAKEFELLKCLYEHKNTIVKKEELFDSVWGDAFYSDGTLNVHIRRLREKIEESPGEPRWIKTVWGTGYILELEEK